MGESVSWLTKIEPEIVKASGLSSHAMRFSFPLDEFAKQLSLNLGIDNLKIVLGILEWKTHENFLSGLGASPVSFSLQIAPLDGPFFFIMALEDIAKFVSWIKDEAGNPYKVEHADLIKGIYRYACLEALSLVGSMDPLKDLAFRLTENEKFDQTSYSIDVSLKRGQSVIWARILVSPQLKKSLENHFALKNPTLRDIQNLPNVKIPLSFQSGSTKLQLEELKSLKKGDIVVLDEIYYQPNQEKGSLKVKIGETAVFQVRVKEGKLKILDYIYSYEENSQ